MKKILFFSLFLLVLSLICSCRKGNGTTKISGKVLEKGSNKGVANAKVIFSECVAGDGSFSPSVCLDVETVLTNAQGEYTFVKENDTATDYRIRAEKTNYGKPVEVFQTANAGENTKNLNFTIPAAAWIKFHVKNVNPFDDSDRLAVFIFNSSSDGIFYGAKVDTTFVKNGFIGNQQNKVNYSSKKNGVYKQFSDSIFCKPLDTVLYEIKY